MAFDREASQPLSVIVIGTGFSGLGMAVGLKQAGIESFVILERAEAVGGTWRDNHYPGCACDVQSHLYSFSFEQNPEWTRMYARQPEIKAYLQHAADKYALMPHVRFGANVVEARYDDATALWQVKTADGRVFVAQVVVSGMGGLSNPAYPKLPGIENFQGKAFHSATWDHAYDLAGKRVAVIGTGASAIQFVPQIADKVGQLDLYQRTPPWIVPKPDRPISARERRWFKRLPFLQRLFRFGIYCAMETRVLGFVLNPKLMLLVQKLALAHIARQVKDPLLRRKLTPDYTIGCKRVLISNDYYPALTKPNVEVVTDSIKEVRAHSIVTADGVERPIDTMIYGTGFAIQTMIPRGTIFGRKGLDMFDVWKEGPQAYLGAAVPGFPNLFMLMGPNTGLGHTSQVFMIESQIRYVMDCLQTMKQRKLRAVEVRAEVYDRFNENLQGQLTQTVWASGCKSWYVNESGRNTTLWPGFTFRFRSKTRHFKAAEYVLEPARVTVSA
ncbi:MAG: NAD(P)/FAD-dependent oxidoreductase [Nevskia sp.]|nr:NAD(P)/FAD-dependent oxidoreductase [Nevskia sp.]